MNGLPYYKRYPRDFIEGTVGMPFELKVTYSFILDLIYMQGGELPDDSRYISGLLGVSVRKWKSLRNGLIDCGKIQVENSKLTNYRAVSEIETLAKLSRKQSENASRPNKNKDLQKPRQSHTEPEPDKEEGSPLLFPPDGGLENDQNSSLPKQSKVEEKPPPKPKRKTRIPEDAVPSEANLAASDKRGISREEANAQYERFKDTHIANGKLFACWDRAWITWLDSPYFRPLTRNGSNDPSIGERSARLGEFAARNF